jgi:hypothetical protein
MANDTPLHVHTQCILTSLSAPGWENYPLYPSSGNTSAMLWNSVVSAQACFITSSTPAVPQYVDE